MRIEGQIKKLRQQAIQPWKVKCTKVQRKEKIINRYLQISLTIQLEEKNQKILAEEGKLKRYRDSVKQNRTFEKTERKFYRLVERVQRQNNMKQKKRNNFEIKYGNWKKIMELLNE